MTMNQRNFHVQRVIAMAFQTLEWTTVVSKFTLMLKSAVQQRLSVVRTEEKIWCHIERAKNSSQNQILAMSVFVIKSLITQQLLRVCIVKS